MRRRIKGFLSRLGKQKRRRKVRRRMGKIKHREIERKTENQKTGTKRASVDGG